MKYDFTSIETLVLVRSSLRKLVKKISQAHYNLISHTNLEDVQAKLKDFQTFINKFQETDEYILLCEYINYVHCPNFFRRINKKFISSLSLEKCTIQDILSILKKINLTLNELEQEITNINEKYFF